MIKTTVSKKKTVVKEAKVPVKKNDTIKKPNDIGAKASAIRKSKLEMIREMQVKEGNFPCFGTADLYCDQTNCAFREDCLNKNY